MSKENPNCNFNTNNPSLTYSAIKCATGSPKDCAAAAVKVITDPCFQQHMINQQSRDPYYHHMPTHDALAAARYSAQMGGEHHDMTGCELM